MDRPTMATRTGLPAVLTLAAAFVLGGAGCVVDLRGSGASIVPVATWPVDPEVLVVQIGDTSTANLTCGETPFPRSGLTAPTGAEKAIGPEFDALRTAFTTWGDAFPNAERLTWQLAVKTDTAALFLAKLPTPNDAVWVEVDVVRTGETWKATGIGDCNPRVALSPDYGPARWALDPAAIAPSASTTQLHLLVWEQTCSSGAPATGRISPVVVDYAPTTLVLTLGVRPRNDSELQHCGGPPGTPVTVNLPQPIGARTLVDGGIEPPVLPASPYDVPVRPS